MKQVFTLVVSIIATIFFMPKSYSEAERAFISGYVKGNSRNEFYLVKNPAVLEAGVQIVFSAGMDLRLVCKVTKVLPRPDCPVQTFSYVPGVNKQGPALFEARLENADTDWHLRQRKAMLLMER